MLDWIRAEIENAKFGYLILKSGEDPYIQSMPYITRHGHLYFSISVLFANKIDAMKEHENLGFLIASTPPIFMTGKVEIIDEDLDEGWKSTSKVLEEKAAGIWDFSPQILTYLHKRILIKFTPAQISVPDSSGNEQVFTLELVG